MHAHPDDETLATGALLALLDASGAQASLVTATRGERGEVRPGVLAPGADLVTLRLGEWAQACAALGVRDARWLGTPPARAAGRAPRRYADSGMAWLDAAETIAGPGVDASPDALALADPAEVAGDIAAAALALGADSLITYDALGGYGHPDHVALHRPTRDAAASLGLPFFELVSQPRSAPTPSGGDILWFDGTSRLVQVSAALAAYSSQLSVDGAELVHVGGQREPIALRVGVRGPC